MTRTIIEKLTNGTDIDRKSQILMGEIRKFHFTTLLITSFLYLSLFESCSNKLETPETIKGINLGMPYENEIKEGINNGLLYDDISKSYSYKIQFDQTGEISCYLNYLVAFDNEGEKIIKWVELTFHDKYNFIYFEDKLVNSITQRELDYLLNSYKDKYGKGKEEMFNIGYPFNTITWIKDDMKICLSYSKTTNSGNIPEGYEKFFEKGYSLSVIYSYTDDIMKELINNQPNHKKSNNNNI